MTEGPIAVIFSGLVPGGTATFVKNNLPGHLLVSYDQIWRELGGDNGRRHVNHLSAREEFVSQITEALAKGQNVVIEPPRGRPRDRQQLVSDCWDWGAGEVVALHLKAPRKVWEDELQVSAWAPALEPGTIQWMWRDHDQCPPDKSEGFSGVYTIDVA